MKKILFVTPSLGVGGTNSSLEALYNHIKEDFEIKVFAISYQTTSRSYSFNDVLIPTNRTLSMLFTNFSVQKGINKYNAFLYKALQSLLRPFGVDLKSVVGKRISRRIEAENNYDYVVAFQEGFATAFVSHFKNQNKIAWIHCDYDNWFPQGSEQDIYEFFSKIVCVSNYTASVFANRYPDLLDRVVSIHNLLDTNRIKELSEQPIDDKRFVTDKYTILSAGRFCGVKRFREIPQIASSLKKQDCHFNWYVIGPDSKDTELSKFYENLIKFDVTDCVKWLDDKPNPYPYFKLADLYVSTSESEACPMVFKEAIFFSLPIVTVDFPSSFEFVKKENGIIVPVEKLSEAIIEMMQQKTTKRTFELDAQENKEVLHSIYSLLG